jgi:hypothetical protein
MRTQARDVALHLLAVEEQTRSLEVFESRIETSWHAGIVEATSVRRRRRVGGAR